MEYARFRDGFVKRRTANSRWEVVDEIPEDALSELEARESRDLYVANHGEPVPKEFARCNEACTVEHHEPVITPDIAQIVVTSGSGSTRAVKRERTEDSERAVAAEST